jgi:hypothetical protein
MTATSYEHPVGDLEPNFRLELRQPAARDGVERGRRAPRADGSWTKPDRPDHRASASPSSSTCSARTARGLQPYRDHHRPTLGVVELVWQSGDPVEQLGAYRVLARILWGNNRPQTVPSRREDPLTLRVVEQAPF